MICPECQQEIPEKNPDRKHGGPMLFCARCLAAKFRQDALEAQKPYLRRVEKGDVPLFFRKRADSKNWHVALLHYRNQAWCGEPIDNAWKGAQFLPWDKAPTATCARCREVIEQMLEDKPAEVA